MTKLLPVSYTHLDVYKRQLIAIVGRGMREARGTAGRIFSALAPVSYTHLDVYKRQIKDSMAHHEG